MGESESLNSMLRRMEKDDIEREMFIAFARDLNNNPGALYDHIVEMIERRAGETND